jgi:hypothetical protein
MGNYVATTSRRELITRVLAAAFIVGSGVVHLQQYYGVHYHVIPVIGPLFLADFVLTLVIGLALLIPVERRSRGLALVIKVGAILFSAGAIIGLAISESGTLFGFHEHGYRLAIVLSIVFEAAAIVTLLASLAAQRRNRRGRQSTVESTPWPEPPTTAVDPAAHAAGRYARRPS